MYLTLPCQIRIVFIFGIRYFYMPRKSHTLRYRRRVIAALGKEHGKSARAAERGSADKVSSEKTPLTHFR